MKKYIVSFIFVLALSTQALAALQVFIPIAFAGAAALHFAAGYAGLSFMLGSGKPSVSGGGNLTHPVNAAWVDLDFVLHEESLKGSMNYADFRALAAQKPESYPQLTAAFNQVIPYLYKTGDVLTPSGGAGNYTLGALYSVTPVCISSTATYSPAYGSGKVTVWEKGGTLTCGTGDTSGFVKVYYATLTSNPITDTPATITPRSPEDIAKVLSGQTEVGSSADILTKYDSEIDELFKNGAYGNDVQLKDLSYNDFLRPNNVASPDTVATYNKNVLLKNASNDYLEKTYQHTLTYEGRKQTAASNTLTAREAFTWASNALAADPTNTTLQSNLTVASNNLNSATELENRAIADYDDAVEAYDKATLDNTILNNSLDTTLDETIKVQTTTETTSEEQAQDQETISGLGNGVGTNTYNATPESPEKSDITALIMGFLSDSPLVGMVQSFQVTTADPACSVSGGEIYGQEFKIDVCRWDSLLRAMGGMMIIIMQGYAILVVVRGW